MSNGRKITISISAEYAMSVYTPETVRADLEDFVESLEKLTEHTPFDFTLESDEEI